MPQTTCHSGLFRRVLAAGLLLLGAVPAVAQPLHFRGAATTLPFSPLHSYVSGEVGEDLMFFGGISGQGFHHLGQGSGIVAFPMSNFNERIFLLDQQSGVLYTGATDHLPTALRNRLRMSNAAEVQFGDTLYIYGGYGAETPTTWYTKASVLQVNLPQVRSALKAGTPVSPTAFSILPSPAAQVAGTSIVRLGADNFALVGGSNFQGDYGLGELNPQPFTNFYSNAVHIFDHTVSMTTPAHTFFDSYWLHRRDLNVAPITVPGPDRPGLAMVCGVFNGASPWENPCTYALGDETITVHDTYVQKMNTYEAAHASFYAAGTGTNRMVILGGLTFQFLLEGEWFYDFLIPWTTCVAEQTFRDGSFVDGAEKIVGYMPLPTTNTRLFLRPNIPVNASGQVLLDQLPHNEHLLGRVVGGLSAEYPDPAPPTFASSNVFNVYVAVGVRGDVTKDGQVSFADLNAVLSQFGQQGPLYTLSADLNLDGTVNFADLNVVLSNFGSNTPG